MGLEYVYSFPPTPHLLWRHPVGEEHFPILTSVTIKLKITACPIKPRYL